VVIVVLAVTFRIALVIALPSVLRSVAGKYDLACTYERLDLTILGADAELWHLVVAPKEGGEPFFHSEYCRADVSVLALFRGRLVVRRLEADGVDVLVERPDGSLPLLKHPEGRGAGGRDGGASPRRRRSRAPAARSTSRRRARSPTAARSREDPTGRHPNARDARHVDVRPPTQSRPECRRV
jgi:hypothetical protein